MKMYADRMLTAAIIGASGYTGAELLRLCAAHPALEVVAATGDSAAGSPVAELYPSLAGAYGDTAFVSYAPSVVDGADVAFLALPHGASQSIVGEVRDRVGRIVDLAADFRLSDPAMYPDWYGEAHAAPELLSEFVFGLPELFREQIRGAELVAAPGCYVTAASLALAPLAAAGVIEPTGIVVDAASGVSGAGRATRAETAFCAVDEDYSAYGLVSHRHTPEMEMAIGACAGADAQVLFTPHLAPMNRGILATCYARPAEPAGAEGALDCLAEAYADEPFVVVSERLPSTKSTLGSNACHITARFDARTGWVIVLSALDNLVKGASGQAIQCANLALGLQEASGLCASGIYP